MTLDQIAAIEHIAVTLGIASMIEEFDSRTNSFFKEEFDPAVRAAYLRLLAEDDNAERLLSAMSEALNEFLSSTSVLDDVLEVALERTGLQTSFSEIKGS